MTGWTPPGGDSNSGQGNSGQGYNPYSDGPPTESYSREPHAEVPTQNPYAAGYPAPYGQGQPGPYPPNQAYGQGYPGYPPPAAGYPPYGYPQAGPRRPGTATAAAVLGFVNGGLLILAGALLLFGASVVSDVESTYGSNHSYSTEFALDGFLNMIAAGLLIAGGVMLTGGNPRARLLYSIGSGIVAGESVYWLIRFPDTVGQPFIVYALLFLALAVIGTSLAWTSSTTRWLGTKRA